MTAGSVREVLTSPEVRVDETAEGRQPTCRPADVPLPCCDSGLEGRESYCRSQDLLSLGGRVVPSSQQSAVGGALIGSSASRGLGPGLRLSSEGQEGERSEQETEEGAASEVGESLQPAGDTVREGGE